MKRKPIFISLFMLSTLICFAQQQSLITGIVFTNDYLPAEGANIVLLSATDSAFITGTAANKNGNFQLKEIPKGLYYVQVSMLGYQKNSCKANILAGKPFMLDTIYLQPEAIGLNTIVVTAKKPAIQIEADKTTINMEATIVNTGGNAFSVLETLPGVYINSNGAVSLNGKNGTKVLIDGKPAYLQGEELVSFLKSTPATSLDKIELITNPSARYDASGNSGLINIRTKKTRIMGFNLGITSNFMQGKYEKSNHSVSFNHRKGKFNLFGMYGYYSGRNYVDLQVIREFEEENPSEQTTFNQLSYRKRNEDSHYYKGGIHYFASSKTTFELALNGYTSNQAESGSLNSNFINHIGKRDSSIKSSTINDNMRNNISGTIGLIHKIDSTGKEFSLSADYLHHAVDNDQYHNDLFLYTSQNEVMAESAGTKKGTIDLLSMRSDFTYPVNEKLLLESGIKSEYVNIDNTSDYKNREQQEWEPDYGLSSHFIYKENINAFYFNSRIAHYKFVLEAGLRIENTNIKGQLPGNRLQADSSFSKSYINLFPSVTLSYQAGKNHTLNLSYRRRIDRPNYQDMNPFVYIFDTYTYEQGNTTLQPQFSDNLELSYLLANNYKVAVFYNQTNDVIAKSFILSENSKRVYVMPKNLATYRSCGIRLSAGNLSPVKYMQSTASIGLTHNQYKWSLIQDANKTAQTTLMFHIGNRFLLGKGWLAELTGYYNGRMAMGQMKIASFGQLTAGIQKKLWNDRASISLYSNDLFHTNRVNMTTRIGNSTARTFEKEDHCILGISFTWKFSKGFESKEFKRKGEAFDTKRINL